MLKVEDLAPDFTLKAHDNTTFVTLSEKRGLGYCFPFILLHLLGFVQIKHVD